MQRGIVIGLKRAWGTSFMVTNKKGDKMTQNWTDLNIDGRRLDRHLRMLDRKLKKTTDDDKIIKICNSICYITSKKIELVNIVLGVNHLRKKMEKKFGKFEYSEI